MDHEKLLDSIVTISHKAGDGILDIYNDKKKSSKIILKDDNSPLTLADKASNTIICKELDKLTPNIPILSEEGKNIESISRKEWNLFWLIDPLDGTKEFINKNGEFTVNIALIENGSPVLGVVYAPVINITWYGGSGIGSYKLTSNMEKNEIKVDIPKNNTNLKIVSSRSHSNNVKLEKFLEKIEKYELIKMGSSMKICLVADGRAHLYPRFGPTMEWDTAAAHAVVKFAGGKIISLDNEKELSYNKEELLNPEFMVQYN